MTTHRETNLDDRSNRFPLCVEHEFVIICEHSTHFMPKAFNGLGLAPENAKSHVAWDPGALAVSEILSAKLNAVLLTAEVSRLLYDCNRPPAASDAIPERSEIIDIPGNKDLSDNDRDRRISDFYEPFHTKLVDSISQLDTPVIVTMHSFTPIYHGKMRDVEVGVLHDIDARLAEALLETADVHTSLRVERNQPYGPEHGVTHTLKEHALPNGHLNVMIEIRNDLIETYTQQLEIANMLVDWLIAAMAKLKTNEVAQC